MRAEIFTAIAKCHHVRLVLSNGPRWFALDTGKTTPDTTLTQLAAQGFKIAGVVGFTRDAQLVTEVNRPEDTPAVLAATLDIVSPILEGMRRGDDLELLALLPDPRSEN